MATGKVWNFIDMLSGRVAILILNQPILVSCDQMIRLWSNAVLRLTVDGGTNRWVSFVTANAAGKVLPDPDYVTGDFDSISQKTKDLCLGKGVTLVPTPDQDETDFTKAVRQVKKVVEEKNLELQCVVAVCETSGRLDQIMANIETLFHASQILVEVPLISLASDSVTWLLQPGSHEIVAAEESVLQKCWCGLIPLSGPTVVTTHGLKWNLENGRLAFGELVSTSNTFVNKTVRVTCDRPLIWTMQLPTL